MNNKPLFVERVINDIRNMVRRDRNHASVILWEPLLNETKYSKEFMKRSYDAVHQERPFKDTYAACDLMSKGQEYFEVVYSHPYDHNYFWGKNIPNTADNRHKYAIDYSKEKRCVFTREWGDDADDWHAQNSPNRVNRAWGERAQLVQSKHYSSPDYLFPSLETFYDASAQHVGGCFWHSFDTQRGYHPDPFYGGFTDIYRQPKYSYYMFSSQRRVSQGYKPMIFIAHTMSPISESDVNIYTNCEEVRLIVYGKDTLVQKVKDLNMHMPSPVVTFKNVYHYMDMKSMLYTKNADVSFVAEGLIGGKVVAKQILKPAMRASKVKLTLADEGVSLVANGSDFVRVIASVTDKDGTVRRLDQSYIKFEVKGEGSIIGNESINDNPKELEWGTAPVLIRSTLKSGKITITASINNGGSVSPIAGELIIESVPSRDKFNFLEKGKFVSYNKNNSTSVTNTDTRKLLKKIKILEQKLNDIHLKEVEKQQTDFE